MCRLAIKKGISTTDEHQSSQDFASCSSINVVEDIFVESAQPPDRHLVSKTNHVVGNIFSKTQLPSSENLFSCSEDSATTSLDLEVLPHDRLISFSGNHIAENTFLESVIPATQQLVSNRDHVAENNILVSQVLPSDHLISYSGNHVAEITPAESQLPPSQSLVSYSKNHFGEIKSQLLASQNLASYSRNHVAEIASLESQKQPNHFVSYSQNHGAENTSTGLQVVPHDILESLRLTDQHLAACSINVVENSFEAEPRLLAEFNTHGGFNGQDSASFSALQSPSYLEHESSYSIGPGFGCDLLNSQFDSEQVIAFSESQQLPNHLISYSRNHVAKNNSTQLQLVSHDILESRILPNKHLAAYSTNVVENFFEAEPGLLAEFNTHSGYNGLNNASFSALQSSIYPEHESSSSNGSSFGCDLLNSQFDGEQVIAFSESQQQPNHLISFSRNHVAENTSTGLQLVTHDILESQILPNKHWATYSTNAVESSFEVEPRLLAEFNTHDGIRGPNNASFSARQSRIHPEQESSYTNDPSFGCDLFNSKLDSEQVIAFPESQQLPNLVSYSRNHVAKSTSTELQLVPHDTLESLMLPNQYRSVFSTNTIGNSVTAEPQLLAEFNTHGGFNGLISASFLAPQSPIYPEQESSYSNGPSYGCEFLNSQFDSEQVDELIDSRGFSE